MQAYFLVKEHEKPDTRHQISIADSVSTIEALKRYLCGLDPDTFQYQIEQLADYNPEQLVLLNGETGAVFADETLLSQCPPSCEARPWIIQLPVPKQPLPAWDNEEPVSQEEIDEFLSRGRDMTAEELEQFEWDTDGTSRPI